MLERGLNLLPCPHCGQPATLWAVDMSEGVYVFCDNCGMRGPVTEEMTEHAAIAAWNALPRRADIERVERERDWLAENMPNDICPAGRAECAYRCPTAGGKACYECLLCWLEAARQATTER